MGGMGEPVPPTPLMFMLDYDWKQLDVAGRALSHESEKLLSSPGFTSANNFLSKLEHFEDGRGIIDIYTRTTGTNQDCLGKTGIYGHSTTTVCLEELIHLLKVLALRL